MHDTNSLTVIVIEPGDLVVISGLGEITPNTAEQIKALRAALPNAKGVFPFEGTVTVSLLHGESANA